MRFLAIITFLLCNLFANANLYLKVGLLQFDNPQEVIVTPTMGSYEVSCDDTLNFNISIGNVLKFVRFQDSLIKIQTIKGEKGVFKNVKLFGNNLNNKFKIKSVKPNLQTKTFNGDLSIQILNEHLQFINSVDIENYVPKVVEAEAGVTAAAEYLKLQAIICRTYAISNLRRHELEGYQLCDKVHCQVYKGNKLVNERVSTAGKATEGQILVDIHQEPINAAFHSNCGGHTLNSEDVWVSPLPYLKAVKDPYCKQGRHSNWKKEVNKTQFLNYYNTLLGVEVKQKDILKYTFNTLVDTRKPNYSYKGKIVPVKMVRRTFKLNSTKFKISESITDNTKFLLTGQGFGHRVGLCQEGAMEMAKRNIHYSKILEHYYKGVRLIYYNDREFLH